MNLSPHNNSIEKWLLSKTKSDFPDSLDYATKYQEIVNLLEPVHAQVNAGADFTDKTTLTRHDKSHINRVITQISKLLGYAQADVTPFEAFHLLVAVQIHDIKNIEGRDGHENNAIEIFKDLKIQGLIDNRILKNIGFIASCHAGSFMREDRKEKDKIGYLLPQYMYQDQFQVRAQFLAALLRLADEYSDETVRAMEYLLKIKKVSKGSIIHQKHAESLRHVSIKADTGVVEFDYYLKIEDAKEMFPKYLKDIDSWEDKYLLDEIFERTVKSHYETVYCMRFLRPSISINKIKVSIEVEKAKITDSMLTLHYEMIEKGYPNSTLNILDLCGESLRRNGEYWSGENLKNYLETNNTVH